MTQPASDTRTYFCAHDVVTVIGNTEPRHYLPLGSTATVLDPPHTAEGLIRVLGTSTATGRPLRQHLNPLDITRRRRSP